MTRIQKRIITLGLVTVLALAAFAAPAWAYFTDVLRASGSHEITLGYSSEVTETHEDPNKSLTDKVISIKNTGETDIMARVFVSHAMEGIAVNVTPSSNDWYSESVSGGTMWTYKRVIPSGKTSGELKVEIGGDLDESYPDFDIVVVGQSSPVAYDENNVAYAYAWSN